jgi:hypothetical protein
VLTENTAPGADRDRTCAARSGSAPRALPPHHTPAPTPGWSDQSDNGQLARPKDREGSEIKALAVAGPPAAVRQHRTDQVDGVLGPAGDQQGSVDIAGIDQVGFRQQTTLRQSVLNRCRHLNVTQASSGSLDIRDQVGRVGIARLGQMDLVADPAGVALSGVANIRIIGRVEALADRRLVGRFALADLILIVAELLDPDDPQCRDRRQPAQPEALGLVEQGASRS